MAAPAPSDKVKDKEYSNWLKVTLALYYMKSGLHTFIKREVDYLHQSLVHKIYGGQTVPLPPCTMCHASRVKRNKYTGVWAFQKRCRSCCDVWLDELLLLHTNPKSEKIYWNNSDITSWPFKPWECAKVFMPRGQQPSNAGPAECDAQALLTLLANCTHFHLKLSPQGQGLTHAISAIRNKVIHDGEMKLSDADRMNSIQQIIQLLEDPVILKSLEDCKAAVGNIHKINNDSLDVFFNLDIELAALRAAVNELRLEHGMQEKRTLDTVEFFKEEYKHLREQLTKRFEDVEKELELHGTRMDTIQRDVQSVKKQTDTALKQQEQKHQEMHATVTHLSESMETMSVCVAEHGARFVTVEESLEVFGIKLQVFEANILTQRENNSGRKRKAAGGVSVCDTSVYTDLAHVLKIIEKNAKINVCLGTDLTEHKIVFVCLYKGVIQKTLKSYMGIDIYYKDSETPSRPLEPPHKMPIMREISLCLEDAKLLQQAIDIHGLALFEQHSNLEAIIGSSFMLSKSNGYIKRPSVVLYCRVKGIAPIGEVAFPTTLTTGVESCKVPVDVREGYLRQGMFKQSTFCKTDWHDKLRMGISIGVEGGSQGTLGPFVKIHNTDIGFPTCAHVIVADPRNKSALKQSEGLQVFQPADGESHSHHQRSHHNRYCGEVSKIVFNPGICDPINGLKEIVGVDAALVTVKGSRLVDPRSFPFIADIDLRNAGFDPDDPPMFGHGSIKKYPLMFDEVQGARVIKYGRTTGLTKGTLLLCGTMVKIHDAELELSSCKEKVIMKGQYVVARQGENRFFNRGDSGSGVFMVEKKNKLTCIGLAIGYLDEWQTVVTLIVYVLKALGLKLDAMEFEVDMNTQD